MRISLRLLGIPCSIGSLLLWIGLAGSAIAQEHASAAPPAAFATLPGGPLASSGGTSITLVGSVATASPAQTVGINGNIVYACDTNEISVIDITNPAAPTVVGTLSSPASTANTYCDVQRGSLVQMINTSLPSFREYSLTNPKSPSLTASTTVNKQFFGPPYFEGNTAYFGTNEITFGSGYPGPITDQAGDFVSMDVTNLSAPVVLGTLEAPTHGSVQGGSFNVYGTIPYSAQLAYVTATTSQGSATQTGVGQLWVVNTNNPSSLSLVKAVNVTGTVQAFAPLIQGNTAVTIGDSGGWRESDSHGLRHHQSAGSADCVDGDYVVFARTGSGHGSSGDRPAPVSVWRCNRRNRLELPSSGRYFQSRKSRSHLGSRFGRHQLSASSREHNLCADQ